MTNPESERYDWITVPTRDYEALQRKAELVDEIAIMLKLLAIETRLVPSDRSRAPYCEWCLEDAPKHLIDCPTAIAKAVLARVAEANR